jgi:hypothetical protein
MLGLPRFLRGAVHLGIKPPVLLPRRSRVGHPHVQPDDRPHVDAILHQLRMPGQRLPRSRTEFRNQVRHERWRRTGHQLGESRQAMVVRKDLDQHVELGDIGEGDQVRLVRQRDARWLGVPQRLPDMAGASAPINDPGHRLVPDASGGRIF